MTRPTDSSCAVVVEDLRRRADIAEQAERLGTHVAKYALADGLRNIALEYEERGLPSSRNGTEEG